MAIAFDAASGSSTTGTSLTFAHTCSGIDRALLVHYISDASGDVVTGITYNGVSMTFVGRVKSPSSRWTGLFYLANPSSGSNNIVVSASASAYIEANAASYTGVAQTGNPEASATNTGASATSVTGTVTTLTDAAWLVMGGHAAAGSHAAGTGTTRRRLGTVGAVFDSNGGLTPAGSHSLQQTHASTNASVYIVSLKPSGSTDSITITSPVQYRVFQRSGSTGSISISGTYTGSPTAIEASFNGGAYSTIDAAPAGGTFSGTLSSQTQGQGTLTVRFTNDTGVSATVADVGIGDVFIVAGDSIADGRATNAQSYTHATLKATAFNQSDAWINGNDPIDIHAANGSHWPLLASQIMEDQGVPVAFITVGAGSTDIAGSATQWVKNNSSYAEMTAQVSASGVNAVKAALFHLGPNAVVNASTISQATYNAAVDTLASNIVSDIAGAPKLHLGLFGEVTTGSPPDRRAAIDNIRAAIIEAQDDNSNVEPGPVLIDQDYSDGVHPKSDAELAIVAKRWWVALDESLYGGSGGRGPRLASARWNPARDQLTVTFDRNLKTGLSFGAGAWIISDNGTPMTITGVAYHGTDAAAVVLTTNAAASGALGTTTVSFASSNDAAGIVIPVSTDVTVPVGAAVQLPAEPLYAETVAESQVSLVVADALHAHSADAIGLSTASILNVAEALHAHAADSLTLSVAGADTLAIADSAHAHTADALALTSASSLAIADASHAHTVDGLTLTAQSVIAIQEALHAHAADNITLSADNSTPLLIAEALHAHTSDGLALTVDAWLVIADALHAHTADAITLGDSGAVVLVVADSVHAHAADNILLSIPGAFRAGNPRVWILDSRQRYSMVDSRRRVVHLN